MRDLSRFILHYDVTYGDNHSAVKMSTSFHAHVNTPAQAVEQAELKLMELSQKDSKVSSWSLIWIEGSQQSEPA